MKRDFDFNFTDELRDSLDSIYARFYEFASDPFRRLSLRDTCVIMDAEEIISLDFHSTYFGINPKQYESSYHKHSLDSELLVNDMWLARTAPHNPNKVVQSYHHKKPFNGRYDNYLHDKSIGKELYAILEIPWLAEGTRDFVFSVDQLLNCYQIHKDEYPIGAYAILYLTDNLSCLDLGLDKDTVYEMLDTCLQSNLDYVQSILEKSYVLYNLKYFPVNLLAKLIELETNDYNE